MTVITTRLLVTAEGTVSTADPLPAGEYDARVDLGDGVALPARPFRIEDLPVHDLQPIGPWPSFSREEIYGDDGR